jgi:ribonuclease HI
MGEVARTAVAYADGSCIGNPGPGGWGVLLIEADGSTRELSGFERSTTNNRMEITAAIQALRAFPHSTELTLHSDSQYLVKTMTLGWKRRENLDLWRELDKEVAHRKVHWEWVRGHAGDPLNDRADELARAAALRKTPAARPASTAASGRAEVRDAAAANADLGGESGESAEMLRALRPLLREDETIRRCVSCGRPFVAPAQATDVCSYCSLAACQLRAREARMSRKD